MYPELTNLLSSAQIQAFRRMYLLRLTTLCVLMLALLVVVHGLLLTPSYLYARTQAAQQEKELAGINASLESSQEKEVKARIKTLGEVVTYLNKTNAPMASDALRAIVETSRTGVRLTGFVYTPSTSAAATSTLVVAGVARTRQDLRQFADTLKALPYVDSADVPIAAYAKESDIDFRITLVGSLRPLQ